MKKTIILIPAILFQLIFTSTLAQATEKPKTDTLVLNLDNRVKLIMPAVDLTELRDLPNPDSLVNRFLDRLSLVSDTLKNRHQLMHIEYYSDDEGKDALHISFQSNGELDVVYDDNIVKEVKRKDQIATIYYGAQTMIIKFPDLEPLFRLRNAGLDRKLQNALDDVDDKGGYQRASRLYEYNFKAGSNVFSGMRSDYVKEYDQLNLMLATGGSLIRHQFVPDWSLNLGLVFARKGVLKNNYYANWNMLYFFDQQADASYKMATNGFLALGYKYNMSSKKDAPQWIGADLAYLVKRDGDYFGKNTFRLGLNWNIGSEWIFNLSVSPQLYFSDGFKEVFPAIRVGIGF